MIQLLKNQIICFSLILLLVVTGCRTALAPNYDKAIVEKTNTTTTQLLQLFAEVADGTTKDSFEKREPIYNNLIGSFDALSILARARPVPTNSISKKIDEILKQRNLPIVTDNHPSAVAFEQIVLAISKMKSKDKEIALSKEAIALFKGQIKVFLDQAITYESYLER